MALRTHTFDVTLDEGVDISVEEVEERIREALGGGVSDINYIGASEDEEEEAADEESA